MPTFSKCRWLPTWDSSDRTQPLYSRIWDQNLSPQQIHTRCELLLMKPHWCGRTPTGSCRITTQQTTQTCTHQQRTTGFGDDAPHNVHFTFRVDHQNKRKVFNSTGQKICQMPSRLFWQPFSRKTWLNQFHSFKTGTFWNKMARVFLPALYAFQINCIRTLEESQKPTQTRQHQQLVFSLLHQVLDSWWKECCSLMAALQHHTLALQFQVCLHVYCTLYSDSEKFFKNKKNNDA